MYPAHTTQARIPEIPVPGYQDHHRPPPPSHPSAAQQVLPPARLPIRVNPSQRWSGAVPLAVGPGYKPTIPSTIHRPRVRPAIHPIQPLLLPGYEHSGTTSSKMSRTFSTQEVMHKLAPSSSHISDGVGKINTHLPSKVPGFWSQAHVYIANLIAQNKDLIQGYKVSNRMPGTAENLTQRYNSSREIILPGSSQHQSYDIIDDKSNGDDLIDVSQIQRAPVPIVRFTDAQSRKRRRTPELERQPATSTSGSIKVPKYDNTLPPEYTSHPKPPYPYPADTAGLRQMMAQNPAFRGLTNINKELTDIRMAMAAEYQANMAMKTLMQGASCLQPTLPNTSLTQHAALVAEERKRRAMRAMIQARSELEEIVAEEAKSALQMSRHTLRERAAVQCSLPAAPSHINIIRPRTILPQPAAAPQTPRILVNKTPAEVQELMINQRMILQRHFLEERKRRMSAAQTMSSAMLPSKFPRIPSPINGHSGELRVDANGKSFIC